MTEARDVLFERQSRGQVIAAWEEDQKLMDRAMEVLTLQSMKIAELADGLADARRIIEAQRAMIATLRAAAAEERAEPSHP